MYLKQHILILLLLFGVSISHAQNSSLREKVIVASDTIQLDSLSIYPNSFELRCDGKLIARDEYKLDYASSKLILKKDCGGELTTKYRVLPMNLAQIYQKRDTSVMFSKEKGFQDRFMIAAVGQTTDVFGGSSLRKSGSISRGISFGNNQDLGVNSSLNLELSGNIAPNLKLLASVTDDNLPIQADGNTNKLQEFDQVFIQVYNDRFKMIAGNFWLKKPTGHFLKYNKRAQGLTVNYQWTADTSKVWNTQVSGALSKGKFQRQIIQGTEGNQGPYRLLGKENEPFIIVLAGTEKVYIDGKLLERGQAYDYTINYNTAEVTFTSRNLITKDRRLVVEFQYSDQNYTRSLFQTSTTYSSKKMKFWFNAYSEQDAKNQPLQQELSISQKKQLASIGDTLSLARVSSIDSIGYFENQNLYAMIDSLGIDSVLLFTAAVDSGFFRATFEFVGIGNGDYVFSHFNALGKVFKWVQPIAGVSQGDYAPSRLIITPKQRQMVTAGVDLNLNKKLKLFTELAYSKNDINTFSRFDAKDNNSFAGKVGLTGDVNLSKDSIPSWILRTKLTMEARDQYFSPIENYRAVEFDRDWNTRNRGYQGNQVESSLGANFINRKYGNLNIEGKSFVIGGDYEGLRGGLNGKWNQKGFNGLWNVSYLSSKTTEQNEFIRSRSDFSQRIKWFKFGYKDDLEVNRFKKDFLQTNSYQFYDYQFYIANSDSAKNQYRVFYRERYDKRSDSTRLIPIAKARSIGGEVGFKNWKNQKLNLIGSYRELAIIDSVLTNQAPENTLLGRIEHNIRLFRNALSLSTFYEVGSGLELRKEFLYIQVNAGQGIYSWIDYNGDGVKDLNEFEIAQFADQASYIRVFTPSNQYVKTFSNEYNQSIYWRPERIWSSKKGILKLLSRFSDQARARIKHKTSFFDGNEAINPFVSSINDTNLLSTNSNLRNTLFFNRTSSIFSAEYTFNDVSSKTLLASGFDSRSDNYNEFSFRWNIRKKYSIKASSKFGNKSARADYVSGRDYELKYYFVEPSLIYQPNTIFRVTLDGRLSEKRNSDLLGGDKASVLEIGTTFKYNQLEKGSLQGGFNVLKIDYLGVQNSALGFEMLEGLKPGINYTWNVGYQRSISKSLQLSFQYNGRKSEGNKTIHAGGMEVRAFF
tara:strand:- start:2103 stop:5537 length:3435 start_codon:yes stop_codon:yes gene_type:complete